MEAARPGEIACYWAALGISQEQTELSERATPRRQLITSSDGASLRNLKREERSRERDQGVGCNPVGGNEDRVRLHCVEAALDCQHGIRHVADNRLASPKASSRDRPETSARPGCKDRRHRDFADVAPHDAAVRPGKAFRETAHSPRGDSHLLEPLALPGSQAAREDRLDHLAA